MRSAPPRPLTVTIASFQDDPLYPRVARAVAAILATSRVVAPVDVLVHMGLLAPDKLAGWRRGEVPYLERVIDCNLTRLSRLLRMLRFHAHDLNLTPSITVYVRKARGPTQRLRFSKSGAPELEEAYARHFVWPSQGPFHPPVRKDMSGSAAVRTHARSRDTAATPAQSGAGTPEFDDGNRAATRVGNPTEPAPLARAENPCKTSRF